ncbi:hypothetical protein AXG93_1217s1270 [Marchantia polymorpha subsp. ruderalis]|uniref:ABC transporter domain-containing protein n=1 Tax=Marchantia polymorpha subsp. ruderalis TaxID=1480154 RepID=A0A176VUV3_MARPO|nr:hypothetical protein AXG93_1217s1270 [Marchantia polymorpha subsp. ruderalis]
MTGRDKKLTLNQATRRQIESPEADSPRPKWSIRNIHRTYNKGPPELRRTTSTSEICARVVTSVANCKPPGAYDVIEQHHEMVDMRIGGSSNEVPASSKRSQDKGPDTVNRLMDQSSTQANVSKSTTKSGVKSTSTTKRKSRRPVYDLVIRNLTYKVNVRVSAKEVKQKTLLHNVTAKASNSEILAIIGRSGSSKTTLLDALAGHINSRSLEGSMLVNGIKVDAGLKSISGYVMQEDALFPMLTTEETLMFSAKLRLPSRSNAKSKRERVQALIEELGLTSCSQTRVGNEKIRGLSGGERRRLSIGVDVIHDPPVLLLDEPTSGLDSTSALQVMETLCKLAVRRRHTIVLTVHQPSFRILDLIHNTLVLARGHVVYHGPVSGMVDHFNALDRPMPEHVNVVEFVLDTIAEFESKPEGLQPLITLQILTSLILVSLFFKSPIAEKGIQQRQTFIIFTVAILVFTSTEALPIFLLERQIFIRENSRGAYRTSSYAVAHSLVVLPFLLFLAILCTCLSYFAVGLVFKASAVLFFILIIFLVLSMSNAFVTCVSAVAPNFTVALAVVGGVSAYMFLFSGFFMNRREIPWYWLWLHYISLFKYSYESLVANELKHRPGTLWYGDISSEDIMDKLLGGNVNQVLNIFIMVIFVVAYRLIFYTALRFYTKSVRR